MKAMIIAALLAASGMAQAATSYDLVPGGCGTNTYGGCTVYQDATTRLNLSWNVNGSLVLVRYDNGAISDTYSANIGASPLNGVSNAVLTDAAGNAAQVSGTFATRRTCVGSGRGQHCTVYVTFLGGTAGL